MNTLESPSRQIGSALRAHALFLFSIIMPSAGVASAGAQTEIPGAPGEPYPDMPFIAPIGVHIGRHLPMPDSSRAPAIDPAKGYRLQMLGKGLYMVTDNVYQSLIMVYEDGVVLVDAPQTYASVLAKAVAEVSNLPITHVIYSHDHLDHIGAVTGLGGHPIIIAHEETKRLILSAKNPIVPVPTVTFADKYTLKVGSRVLELSYHGIAHEPGNIFIYAPAQRTLMVVDVVFPGWMPGRRFALSKDIPGYFRQVEEINKMDFDTFVGGHVQRTGIHADVATQPEFMNDLKRAAAKALQTTKPGEMIDPRNADNGWAVFGGYVDRVVVQTVNEVTPKWSNRLAAYDVFIWDQAYAMEQSLRLDQW